MKPRLKPTLLAAAIGLLACTAGAQSATDTSSRDHAARMRELDAARADLDRAAMRVAKLSRELGEPNTTIIEQRFERRPVLGVVLAPEARSGVLIAGVTPDSAAASAGLRSGDVITAIDGKTIVGADDAARLADARARLRTLDTRSPLAIAYRRDGRDATVKVTPQLGERVIVMRDGEGHAIAHGGPRIEHGANGEVMIVADAIDVAPVVAVAPQVRQEIIRLAPSGDCKDDDCKLPVLAEAFRWSGLNLASIDAQLGRYFGTDRGVLVLSTGPELTGLQPGDVIQRIDGKTVNSPREAMAALRGKPAGSKVDVTYWRDRKSATSQLTVPKAMPWPLPPAPPMPPGPPPVPPVPPSAIDAPPPPPPAAPKPPAPPTAAAPLPAPPAPPVPPQPPRAPALSLLVEY